MARDLLHGTADRPGDHEPRITGYKANLDGGLRGLRLDWQICWSGQGSSGSKTGEEASGSVSGSIMRRLALVGTRWQLLRTRASLADLLAGPSQGGIAARASAMFARHGRVSRRAAPQIQYGAKWRTR